MIRTGAWAEWARELGLPARPAIDPAPRSARVASDGFELNAAVYPRGSGLRWGL